MKLTITRLGHFGDGIGEGPVFVPRTLPGEVVDGEPEGDRISAYRILEPSPERVSAPCPHYRTCGGCHLQHASDDFVARWKTGIVAEALAAQGLDAPIRRLSTSPPRSRRRATLHGRRLRNGAVVGFHARASDSLVAVPDCLLLRPAIMEGFAAFEALTVLGASRKSEIDLAVTETDSGLDVMVTGARSLDREGLAAAVGIAGKHDLAKISWNGETLAERRPPRVRLGRALVVLPSGAFLQATNEGQAALVSAVTEAVGGAGRVVDLFAGCGTFALPLSERSAVTAVEASAEMLDALLRGWRGTSGLRRIEVETRDLFRRPLLPDELSAFDAVVIDPPRAGAQAQTLEIARSSVPRVAAVSCNPVTFARDARVLVDAGFSLDWVDVVDQFRWSPHVELAACFTRDHMAGERYRERT